MLQAQLTHTAHVGGTAATLSSPLAGSRLWTSAFLSHEERWALHDAILPAQTVGPNANLVREGARADELSIVLSGWACRYSTTSDGGRQLPGLFLPGDIGNLDSLMFDRLDYGVRTLSAATIVALPREHALELAERHPGIAQTFTWLALLENTILAKWTQSLGRRMAKSRLAHLLCELSARLGGGGEGESSFRFPLTQEQMADALGLTAVHVNRVLQELRTEGLVATQYRTMILPDVARLRQSCGFDPSYLHLEPPCTRAGTMVRRVV